MEDFVVEAAEKDDVHDLDSCQCSEKHHHEVHTVKQLLGWRNLYCLNFSSSLPLLWSRPADLNLYIDSFSEGLFNQMFQHNLLTPFAANNSIQIGLTKP